jgi:hypothetical protein
MVARGLGETGVLLFNSIIRGGFLVLPDPIPLMAEVNPEGGAEDLS